MPCLLLSGSAEADVVDTSWLTKPVDIKVFTEALAAYLDGRSRVRTA